MDTQSPMIGSIDGSTPSVSLRGGASSLPFSSDVLADACLSPVVVDISSGTRRSKALTRDGRLILRPRFHPFAARWRIKDRVSLSISLLLSINVNSMALLAFVWLTLAV